MDSKNLNLLLCILILLLSVVGIVLIAVGPFGVLYIPGYGLRYSCLGCEYYTYTDLAAQVIMIILLSIVSLVAINELLPNKLFDLGMINRIGALLGVCTAAFAILGGAAFSFWWIDYAAWYDVGYYGGLSAGLCDALLFVIREKCG